MCIWADTAVYMCMTIVNVCACVDTAVCTSMQKRQQEERLRRLENERRILQEKANKLQQLNRLRQEQRLTSSQENMQAAVNATQEMLMRQNLNDSAAPNQAPLTGMDAFLSTAQQVAAAQNELHNR